jgi:hypothetical protein
MGCTTITYDAPLKKYLMCVTDGWPGWLGYSANFHKSYFGNRTAADPIGSRYAWTLQEVMLLDGAALKSIETAAEKGSGDPLKSDKNIALRARVNVSSVHKKNKPFTELIEYFGEGAVDGIVDLRDDINRNEWVSRGELETAMIRLSWDQPETVSRVWLFDRPNPKDHIASGVLLFSDGSAVKVGELPNDAKSAREVSFPAKQVRWIVFAVDSVSKETSNAGLAEFAVFGEGE